MSASIIAYERIIQTQQICTFYGSKGLDLVQLVNVFLICYFTHNIRMIQHFLTKTCSWFPS